MSISCYAIFWIEFVGIGTKVHLNLEICCYHFKSSCANHYDGLLSQYNSRDKMEWMEKHAILFSKWTESFLIWGLKRKSMLFVTTITAVACSQVGNPNKLLSAFPGCAMFHCWVAFKWNSLAGSSPLSHFYSIEIEYNLEY